MTQSPKEQMNSPKWPYTFKRESPFNVFQKSIPRELVKANKLRPREMWPDSIHQLLHFKSRMKVQVCRKTFFFCKQTEARKTKICAFSPESSPPTLYICKSLYAGGFTYSSNCLAFSKHVYQCARHCARNLFTTKTEAIGRS